MSRKKIEELTKEQHSHMSVVIDRYVHPLLSCDMYRNFDNDRCISAAKAMYKICSLNNPVVVITESPLGASVALSCIQNIGTHDAASTNSVVASVRASVGASVWDSVGASVGASVMDSVRASLADDFSYYGNVSDCGWLSFQEFFFDINAIQVSEELKMKWDVVREVYFSGTFMSIQRDCVVVISKPPKSIVKNNDGLLHNAFGPSVEFGDGYSQWFINGRSVSESLFNECSEISNAKTAFFSTDNEDDKAIICTIVRERFGSDGLMDMLEAYEYSTETVRHSDSYSETLSLYRTKASFPFLSDRHGNMNQPYCWLKMTCPSTGATYLIDTSSDFKSATEAAKFHRPAPIPFEVPYNWPIFAN